MRGGQQCRARHPTERGPRIAPPAVPWPGPAVNPACEYSDVFDAWVCGGLPPPPWPGPEPATGWDPTVYGPPGTLWFYSRAALDELSESLGEKLLSFFLRKLVPYPVPQGGGGYVWTVPEPLAPPTPPEGTRMRWMQTTIIGSLDLDETVAHVLKWRHSTQEDAPADLASVKAFGDKVRTEFLAFLGNPAGTVQAPLTYMTPNLVYREVRTAFLEQTAPGPWVEHGPGTTQIQHPGQKPTWVIPSQISAMNAPGASTGTASLPYEVAMVVSHNTNFRGPRFRGRTYLGPFSTSVMAPGGQFNRAVVDGFGAAFGAFLARVEAGTDYELHVVSQKFCTSAKVIGTRIGAVPDSQRRRRRAKPEAWAQVHGQPIGSL